MTVTARVLFGLLTICGLLINSISDPLAQSPENAVGLSEDSMRWAAGRAPMPEYPDPSLKRKSSGVAVAAVVFGADGRTQTVTILEAPDKDIAEATRATLMRWMWKPVEVRGRAERYGGRGKLTFYFRITDGQGKVVNPELPARPSADAPRGRGAAPATTYAGGHRASAPEIPHAELKTVMARVSPLLLDIGDREAFKRGHLAGAINIPVDELIVRARMEMDPQKALVIDCTQEERPRCDRAVATLRQIGFADLSLVVR